MIRSRPIGTVVVARPSRHRLLNRKPRIGKKWLNDVIHVTIGSRSGSHPAKNQAWEKDRNSTKKSWAQTSDATKTSYLSTSSRVVPFRDLITHKQQQQENQSSDQIGMTNDYHHKPRETKTKKCSLRCLIVSLLLTMVVVAIILTVSFVLLLKPQTKTITPTTTPVLRWNTTGITVAGQVGNPGNASNQLDAPLDVDLDWANNLYIADYSNNRVQKYLFNTLVGMTVAGNGEPGRSPSHLHNPIRVLLDSNEDLYITDIRNNRIQFWSKGAANGTTIAGKTGVSGNASDELSNPYGIALHPTSDALYIADFFNNRIMSYASGARNGTLLLGANGQGTSSAQLNNPIGLYFDSFWNSLLIANYGAHNIVRYVLGATNWTLVAGSINGVAGTSSTTFTSPVDVTCDPMGNLYVADRDNHRIQFFSGGVMNGTTIAGITRRNDTNATTLSSPWSVSLDSQLNLYVADAGNHRIQKFVRY